MRCSYCENFRGGAYKDWVKGFSFNLCFDCTKELGFFPTCLNTQKKCSSCGKYYTPKGTWQKDCTDCWLKTQPKKCFTFTAAGSHNPQRKLMGVLAW